MNIRQKNRLTAIILLLVVAIALLATVFFALKENIDAYLTPTDLVTGNYAANAKLRLGGQVVTNSIEHTRNANKELTVKFSLYDGSNTINVEYNGLLPSLFREGDLALAVGNVKNSDKSLVFLANQVVAKHDENYIPKELEQLSQQIRKKQSNER